MYLSNILTGKKWLWFVINYYIIPLLKKKKKKSPLSYKKYRRDTIVLALLPYIPLNFLPIWREKYFVAREENNSHQIFHPSSIYIWLMEIV